MFKKLIVVLVVLVAAFCIVVAMQPAEFQISKSAAMAASASEVFEQVNDFQKWDKWSPWVKLDPAAKMTFEGPATGTGAICKWSGNSEVGEGSMTITESKPHELIKIKLDFIEPMAGTSDVAFTFKPEGDKTLVTWSMSGKNNFINKAMCLVMNMDKMIGDNFAQGLTSMKAIVEAKKDTSNDPKK